MTNNAEIFFSVITCRKYINRHTLQLKHWSRYLKNVFNMPYFIYENDVDDLPYFKYPYYDEGEWDQHIKHGQEIFIRNIADCSSLDNKYLNSLELSSLFPKRKLKEAEVSLLHKHYKFLKLASSQKYPSLVIEDDAWLENANDIGCLISKCSKLNPDVGFLNLSLLDSTRRRVIPLHSIQPARIETTCAYCIHPQIAKVLVERFFPYSLPIDFHLQHLLCKYALKGLMTQKACFLNLSNRNYVQSTIQ